jgi:hypothetical protein
MDEEFDSITAIRLIALNNVFESSAYDYVLRKITRFYSNKFNTPLSRSRKDTYT